MADPLESDTITSTEELSNPVCQNVCDCKIIYDCDNLFSEKDTTVCANSEYLKFHQSYLLSGCQTDANDNSTNNIEDISNENTETYLELDCKTSQETNNTQTSERDVIEIKVENCESDDEPNVNTFFNILPVSALEDLATSDYLHNRQLAVRKILEFLKQAGSNEKEIQSVISVMCKLSEDEEAVVQFELMQQIPDIAAYCQSEPHLKIIIRQQLMPYTVRLLNDNQVIIRKSGQSTLLILLEKNLIDKSQLIEWICPLISQSVTCEMNIEELRLEDVTFMTKMIPLIGREITLKFFLDPFISLCCDPSSGIRKVCALGFGAFCLIVGVETTELSMLPAFLNLCNDEIWQVRKACASVFIDVANSVTMKTRKEILPHIFVNLLTDNHNNVKFSAYQNLGTFIYTFADPKHSGFSYNDGKLIMNEQIVENSNFIYDESYTQTALLPSFCRNEIALNCPRKLDSVAVELKNGHVHLRVDNDNVFNNFQFWRNPLPEVELDIDIEDGKSSNIHVRASVRGDDNQKKSSEIKVHISPNNTINSESFQDISETNEMLLQTACINTLEHCLLDDSDTLCSSLKEIVLKFKSDGDSSDHLLSSNINKSTVELDLIKKEGFIMTPYEQDIVPPILLYSFISVVSDYPCEVNKASEDEKLGYIAYSFPAVALTLGRTYWPCIKKTCEKLARNMKWTVRRTIASSLHELATILGYDIIITDLLPIFLDLFKDVDEVRLRLVQHLSDFLKHLHPYDRKQFLPLVEDFTKVDNDKNWRFRCAVAEQLTKTAGLYDAAEIPEYFLPVASTLLHDKVYTVRLAAVELMAVLLKQMHQNGKMENYYEIMLGGLDDLYRRSPKWVWRQTYIKLCEQLVLKETMLMTEFIEKVVPKLFSLAWDEVPNVRLCLVSCILRNLIPMNLMSSIESSPYRELLAKMLDSLTLDVDKDVRFTAEECLIVIKQQ